MATDNKAIAEAVLKEVGGKENVRSVFHCVTRLRFVLADEGKANDDAIRAIKGVQGVVKQGGQYQVIIGTNVGKVADELSAISGLALGDEVRDDAAEKADLGGKAKHNIFNSFFKTISAAIIPFMGLMIASGMIKGILTLLTTIGLITTDSGTYMLLYAGADALMYFMPIIIGFSAGKHFGANPYITAAIGAALVYPNIVSAYNDGAQLTFLGIPVVLTSYANSVFPILLASWVASKVQKFWEKVLPDVIQMMFVPALTIIVMVPLSFLAIGPVMTLLSDGLAAGINGIWGASPVVAGAILGAFWQVIVIFGLHYAFIPILTNNIAVYGVDPINAVLGMTVMALVGAGLGYALKQRKADVRTEALTVTLTAFLGVTEPIIYSVALPKKKPFVCAFIGGGVAGAVLAASGACMQGFGNGGIFQAFMMISPTDPMNLAWFFICSAIAVVISAVLSFIVCDAE